MTVQVSGLGLVLAFGAGVLSFLSPCCVPLVPAYLGYMSGMSVDEIRSTQSAGRLRLMAISLSFVLGLAVVFTLLGASASAAGQLLLEFRPLVLKLGGVLIIVFGLHLLGVFRLPLLWSERRLEFAGYGNGGPGGAFLMGSAFAIGWTPCIGPMLAGILTVASQTESVYQGMLLLFAYGFGLGVPFVLAGLLFSRWGGLQKVLKRYAGVISAVSGALMIVLGVLVFSGRLALITAWATSRFGLGLAL
jgi:cytochrome c-type biogenesis protein